MASCSFCGKSFANKGMMFVLSTGQVMYFCSSKCDKNHQLKRKGRMTRWTKTAHDLKKGARTAGSAGRMSSPASKSSAPAADL